MKKRTKHDNFRVRLVRSLPQHWNARNKIQWLFPGEDLKKKNSTLFSSLRLSPFPISAQYLAQKFDQREIRTTFYERLEKTGAKNSRCFYRPLDSPLNHQNNHYNYRVTTSMSFSGASTRSINKGIIVSINSLYYARKKIFPCRKSRFISLWRFLIGRSYRWVLGSINGARNSLSSENTIS